MYTLRFSHLTHIVLAGLICGLFAGGAVAKPEVDKSSGVPEKRSAEAKDKQSYQPDSTQDKRAKEEAAAATARGWSYDYGDKSSKPGYGKPPTEYKPNPKPKYDYRQPAETRGKHDADYRRYPGRTTVYTPPVYRGGYYYYSSRPANPGCHYGHWVFDDCGYAYCRKSLYFHYGRFPYISAVRVQVGPYVSPSYYGRNLDTARGGYYDLSDGDLDDALANIRSAWVDGRYDLMRGRVYSSQNIAILLDGRYEYSLRADDYAQMTYDAIDQIQTAGFTWESVRERIDATYTAFGKHTYYSESGIRQVMYVSYTLRKMGAKFIITEVGTSRSPLD